MKSTREQEAPIHPIHGAAENNSGGTSRTTADSSQSVLGNVAEYYEGSESTSITVPDDHVVDAPPNDASVGIGNAAPTTSPALASSSAQSSVVPPNDAAPTHADLVEQINQVPMFTPEWFQLKLELELMQKKSKKSGHAAASTTTTANRAAGEQTIEDINLPSNNAEAGVHQDGPSQTSPSPASAAQNSFVDLEVVQESGDAPMPLQYLESSLFKDEDAIKKSSAQASMNRMGPELVDAERHPPLHPWFEDRNADKKPAASSSKKGKKGKLEEVCNNNHWASAPLPSNAQSQSSTLRPNIAPFQTLPPSPLPNTVPPLVPLPPTPPSEPTFYAVEATLVRQESEAVVVPVQQPSAPVYDAVLVPDQGSPPVLVPSRAKYKHCIFTGVTLTFFVIGVTVGAIIASKNSKQANVTQVGDNLRGSLPTLQPSPSPSSASLLIDNNAEDGKESIPTASPTILPTASPTSPPTLSSSQFLKPNGQLISKIRMINPTITNGYETCDALKEDIINALHHYANTVIQNELRYHNWYYDRCDSNDDTLYRGEYDYPDDGIAFAPVAETAMEDSSSSSKNEAVGSALPLEDSFGTNNQVEGVDEADIVKSDGDWVYAGYGDILFVWNALNGTTGISITKMPYNDTSDQNCSYPIYDDPPNIIYDDVAFSEEAAATEEPATEEVFATSSSSSGSNGKKTRRHHHHRNRRRTQEKKSMMYPYPMPCYQPPKPRIQSLLLEGTRLTAIVSEENYNPWRYDSKDYKTPIIDDYQSLVIRVYDVSSIPTDGSPLPLLGERKVKGNYNSGRSFNTTGILITTSYVNTWEFASDLYRYLPKYCGLNATDYAALAYETALNKTDEFMEQMVEELELNGECSHIFQISAMQSGNNTESSDGNLLSNFVQVSSFDMAANYVDQEIPISVAGAFSQGYLSSVYVSQDFVGTLNVGNSYNPSTKSWDTSTFILGFGIRGTPTPLSVGKVPGSPINQYASDLYDGHLRIATTESRWWEEPTDDPLVSTFQSSTTNKIFILKVPEEGEGAAMNLTGVTDHLGKPDESIFAVRFIGDKGYVVTFEQIDPFLVVDLSDYTDPKVIGELEIPGFSSYLHYIELDNVPHILGVGQHVNEDDIWASWDGVKISLFDISDPTNPKEKATLIDKNAYSNAQNDFKSFRYLPQSQKLILPKSEYTWGAEGNFDGFVVYDVSVDNITSSYEIQHAESNDIYNGCWYNAYMPPRSLVFQSKVTTILSHSVISTDLNTGVEEWKLDLDEGLNNTDCRSYFGIGFIDRN